MCWYARTHARTQAIGGLGAKSIGSAHLTEAVAAHDSGLARQLTVHETWGVRALLAAGTDAQRTAHLAQLAAGRCRASCALIDAADTAGCRAVRLGPAAHAGHGATGWRLSSHKLASEAAGRVDLLVVLVDRLATGGRAAAEEQQEQQSPTLFLVQRSDANLSLDGTQMAPKWNTPTGCSLTNSTSVVNKSKTLLLPFFKRTNSGFFIQNQFQIDHHTKVAISAYKMLKST
jgi:hypothetical protein